MERVYHYTTMNAFLKLIESIKDSSDKKSLVFWATNIFFLNDPQEFIYGQEALMEVLKEIECDKDVEFGLRLTSLFSNHKEKTEKEWLHELLDGIHKQNESPYVISFSRNEDSLPTWLNYGDGGKGVCLAFAEYRSKIQTDGLDFKSIINAKVEIFDQLGTYDVSYDAKSLGNKDNYLRKVLDYLYDYYLNNIKTTPPNKILGLQIGMHRAFAEVISPYFKTKFYEREREVRMSKTIKREKGNKLSEIKFRCNAKGHLIPYIEIEIPTKQLEFVRIGPLADKELSKKVIEMIKAKYELKFDIKESRVQYRDY